MLLRKHRIQLDRPLEVWMEHAIAQPGIELLGIDPPLAIAVGRDVPGLHHDPADRFIAMSALQRGCPVITKDRALQAFTAIATIW